MLLTCLALGLAQAVPPSGALSSDVLTATLSLPLCLLLRGHLPYPLPISLLRFIFLQSTSPHLTYYIFVRHLPPPIKMSAPQGKDLSVLFIAVPQSLEQCPEHTG